MNMWYPITAFAENNKDKEVSDISYTVLKSPHTYTIICNIWSNLENYIYFIDTLHDPIHIYDYKIKEYKNTLREVKVFCNTQDISLNISAELMNFLGGLD